MPTFAKQGTAKSFQGGPATGGGFLPTSHVSLREEKPMPYHHHELCLSVPCCLTGI